MQRGSDLPRAGAYETLDFFALSLAVSGAARFVVP